MKILARFVPFSILIALAAATLPAFADAVTIPVKASMLRSSGAGGWSPSLITVKKGDVVTLQITSADMGHQLSIPAYGIKSPIVNGGQTAAFTFTASKAGTFGFECSNVCGPLHSQMKGTLIVQP